MRSPHDIFDRDLLRARRRRAAAGAAGHDFLMRRAADDLLDRLGLIRRTFAAAVVLGDDLGLVAPRLRSEFGVGLVVTLDPLAARPGSVAADPELLPLADASLDLVIAPLSLQTVNDLPGTLVQVRRALKPDGLFLATLVAGRSLGELRQAFLEADIETGAGAAPRVHPFADVRQLGGLLQRAGFALPVVDGDCIEVAYEDPLALLRELRAMGESNVLIERSRRPLRRATVLRLCEIYVQKFSTPAGRIRATFELVTLTGWAPHDSQQKPLRPGSAAMPLAEALGRPNLRPGRR